MQMGFAEGGRGGGGQGLVKQGWNTFKWSVPRPQGQADKLIWGQRTFRQRDGGDDASGPKCPYRPPVTVIGGLPWYNSKGQLSPAA